MRIAFLSIPRFPCAVEIQRDRDLAGKSLIVGDADQPKKVLACSSEAQALGVRPGLAIRKALALNPDATVLPPDPVIYSNRWQSVLEALDEVSPEVEDEEWGRAYLNAGGLQAHYRDEASLCRHIVSTVRAASGLVCAVGLAGSKFPAFAAAHSVRPGEVRAIPAGAEAAFLHPFDVSLLPLDSEIVQRLQVLGLETLAEVATLSLPELQSQFGFQGERLWQLANGNDAAPLRPRARRESVEAALDFEAPVAGIEVLIAASKQLVSRLRLPLKGRAARELVLQAELVSGRGWERRLVFREAIGLGQSGEDGRLAFVLRSSLANFPPPQAVRALSLRLSGLSGETGRQLSLGEKGRQQRQLQEAVRQLKARYGFSPIYQCVDVEPWSAVPEERQILVESDG
jgi:DNA polymerase IV